MNRQLRPRHGRPRYAAQDLNDQEHGDGVTAGPSNRLADDDEDSGSDFVPDVSLPGRPEERVSPDSEKDRDQPTSVPSSATFGRVKVSMKAKGKQKAMNEAPSKSSIIQLAPGLARPSNRQMYALPTPSMHHRHRAVALFTRPGQVERLEFPPPLFGPVITVPTNNFTHNALVTDRTNKAWGYNVGSGPLWGLMEDRGWYKEALPTENGVDREMNRRPIVHSNQNVMDGWSVLGADDALSYLPSDILLPTEDGFQNLPRSETCFFGPFGRQIRIEMKIFDSVKMSEFIPESKAHAFYAGAPVWGLDWCPIHPSDRPYRSYKQYLAVAPFSSSTLSPEIGHKDPRPSKACIQIWSLNPEKMQVMGQDILSNIEDEAIQSHASGAMSCEMVLCVDAGPAHEIRWCPLPSHDTILEKKDIMVPKKLGLLAGTFLDGSLSVYVVPDPLDISPTRHDTSQPVFVHIPHPLLRAELEETACWCLDWANSEVIAVGTTNGVIAVYNIGEALRKFNRSHIYNPHPDKTTDLLPTHYITVHQSAIRALAWIRTPPTDSSGAFSADEDPTVIASGGYDGLECLTDIREATGCVMNRTRDIINTVTFSPFVGGPVTIDHENIIKAYSASPSMLGRGHTLSEPDGPVWSIHASDYHPHLVVGCSDGSCSTTNSLRSTRRGSSTPFFVHKIYHMDYSRKTAEFRMLERFLPEQTQDKPTSTAAKSRVKSTESEKTSTGAWPPQVGIHRVVWNNGNGLGAAGIMASATGSGICRVDFLQGRWLKGKIPYGNIAKVRGELHGDDMDVDNTSSEE